MDSTALITFTTAMFTILNPIGNIAIFAGMVSGRTEAGQRAVAIQCAIAVAVILVTTVWLGEWILHVFGVQIPALQVAGGIMIASIALSMLHSTQSGIHDTKGDATDVSAEQSIAIVPLAMPVIAGPGAMVTVIVNTHEHSGLEANLLMSAVCVGLAVVICLGFLASELITRLLGQSGMDIVTKLMGMVLLAISIAMFAEGAKALLPGLA